MNGRPDRDYLIASPGTFFGPEYYEMLGYQRVERTKDGPDFHFGSAGALGSELGFQGGITMECPKEITEQRKQYGDFGAGGQELVDQLEQRMIDQTRNPDPSRGIYRQALVPIEADQSSGIERSIATDQAMERVEDADY